MTLPVFPNPELPVSQTILKLTVDGVLLTLLYQATNVSNLPHCQLIEACNDMFIHLSIYFTQPLISFIYQEKNNSNYRRLLHTHTRELVLLALADCGDETS
jgi:hypothetical protein